MRKIINSTYITLDGAVEDPHLWPSLGDAGSEESFGIQMDLLNACDTILMGRRTYEIFASAWPTRSGDAMSDCIRSRFTATRRTATLTGRWDSSKAGEPARSSSRNSQRH